jgi:hypothetical protein
MSLALLRPIAEEVAEVMHQCAIGFPSLLTYHPRFADFVPENPGATVLLVRITGETY